MFRAFCMAVVEGRVGGGETTTVTGADFLVVSLTEVAVTVTVRLPETIAGAM